MSEELARRDVAIAFASGGTQDGYAEQYIERLEQNWNAITKSMVRTATLFILLVVVFYLLTLPGAVEELSLGPFKIKDLVVVATFIPLLTACLFYDFTLLSKRWRDSRDVFRALIHLFHPKVYERNLELLIQPQPASFAGQTEHYYPLAGDRLVFSKLHLITGAFVLPLIIATLLPLSFEIGAYVYLFAKFPGWAATISAIGAAVFVFLTLTTYQVKESAPAPRS